MENKYQFGMEGQQYAEKYLTQKGYAIVKRNYYTKVGEIDLIARFGEYIIFVEVKYRSGTGHGLPREAVGRGKQRKIIKTAMYYIMENNLDDQDFRFDVVEVLKFGDGVKIEHIVDAFGV